MELIKEFQPIIELLILVVVWAYTWKQFHGYDFRNDRRK